MHKFSRHYQESILIQSSPDDLFSFVDNHKNFSSHMNKKSWMMGGGRMQTETDAGHGQSVGSHIRMQGKAFGLDIFLDEVITKHEVPKYKEWETVSEPKLVVIGEYRMGFTIEEQANQSSLKVYIDYDLPRHNTWLGFFFGNLYAKWCVHQMVTGVSSNWQQ